MKFASLSPAVRFALAGAAAVAAVLLLAFVWVVMGPGPMSFAQGQRVALADYKGKDPTGAAPPYSAAPDVLKGGYLATAADCVACHTTPGGILFAGGRAFKTPYGTIYSPNITPDNDTGIGAWTDQEFIRAVREGIAKNGEHLYPAFPYASYTYLTDADVLAIKAYIFAQAPITNVAPTTALKFPYNQRWLMGIWSMFFNPNERFQPVADQSPEWNRGAYLVEALQHCGDCHTPRNILQGLNNRKKFSGTLISGWRAYNITSDKATGVGAWTDEELANFLYLGHADGRSTATGPMGEAVDFSMSYLSDPDISAMVTYLRSIPALSTPEFPAAPETPPKVADTRDASQGERLFASACASCHGWDGEGQLNAFATIVRARSVFDPTAVNVAQVIVAGAHRTALASQDVAAASAGGPNVMPSFGAAYSDAEIAAIANYVTGRFGGKAGQLTAKDVADLRAQTSQ